MYDFVGIVPTGRGFIIAGKFRLQSGSCSPNSNKGANLSHFSSQDGSLLISKSYCYASAADNTSFTGGGTSEIIKTSEDHFRALIDNAGQNNAERIVIVSFDTLLNLKSSKSVRDTQPVNGYDYVSLHYSLNSRGDYAIGAFDANSQQSSAYMLVDSNHHIVRQGFVHFDPGFTRNIFVSDVASLNNYKLALYYSGPGGVQNISFNLYHADTSCVGPEGNFATVVDYPLIPSNWTLSPSNNDVLFQAPFSIDVSHTVLQTELLCQKIFQAPVFSLGSDKTKCNDDSVAIHASPGFSKYNWIPQYNIMRASDSIAKVYPDTSQTYMVSAEAFPGCEVKDTVNIFVNRSAAINLGRDTSFCEGESILLNVGNPFSGYLWNGKPGSASLTVDRPGAYSIEAIALNGCSSKDTINILHLYPKPTAFLPPAGILCRAQTDTLKTNKNFRQYYWQDGNTSNSLVVNQPGQYWLRVTDQNGCSGTDSVIIKGIHDTPKNFLMPDTMICSYNKLTLTTTSAFNKYLWSNGSFASTTEITGEGNYVLQVTDAVGCIGLDTVSVKFMNCPNRIHFPNAFTPNNDGVNDGFKPFVTGDIVDYDFRIFNRWGQLVFQTKNRFHFGMGSGKIISLIVEPLYGSANINSEMKKLL